MYYRNQLWRTSGIRVTKGNLHSTLWFRYNAFERQNAEGFLTGSSSFNADTWPGYNEKVPGSYLYLNIAKKTRLPSIVITSGSIPVITCARVSLWRVL